MIAEALLAVLYVLGLFMAKEFYPGAMKDALRGDEGIARITLWTCVTLWPVIELHNLGANKNGS